jgi:hypothetical protein
MSWIIKSCYVPPARSFLKNHLLHQKGIRFVHLDLGLQIKVDLRLDYLVKFNFIGLGSFALDYLHQVVNFPSKYLQSFNSIEHYFLLPFIY